MKLKEGFILRRVGSETVVIPSGKGLDLNMMITLNETARFLWERMAEGTERNALIAAVCGEYEVEEAEAAKHVDAFIAKLSENGFLA